MDEYYKIKHDTMEQIADCTRRLTAVRSTLTPKEIIWWLSWLAGEWNLKSEAKDDIEFFDLNIPKVELQACVEYLQTILQQEDRLNTYTDEIPTNHFSCRKPNRISFKDGVTDTLISANPFSGELASELSQYDPTAIRTAFGDLADIITSWSFQNTISEIDIGNIGIIDVDIDIIPKGNVSSISGGKT